MEDIRNRYRARVESIREIEPSLAPALPGAKPAEKFNRAEITVSWSIENFGQNLPTLVSTVAGNLYELREFSGLKLHLTSDIPESFAKACSSARNGIEGTRRD